MSSWNLRVLDERLIEFGSKKEADEFMDVEAAKVLIASGLLNVPNVVEEYHYCPFTGTHNWAVFIDSRGWTGK